MYGTAVEQYIEDIFEKQMRDARRRQMQEGFEPTGDAVAHAAQWAFGSLRTVPRIPKENYLERCLERLNKAHQEYRQSADDDAGYGSATFHEMRRDLERLLPGGQKEETAPTYEAPQPAAKECWPLRAASALRNMSGDKYVLCILVALLIVGGLVQLNLDTITANQESLKLWGMRMGLGSALLLLLWFSLLYPLFTKQYHRFVLQLLLDGFALLLAVGVLLLTQVLPDIFKFLLLIPATMLFVLLISGLVSAYWFD